MTKTNANLTTIAMGSPNN